MPVLNPDAVPISEIMTRETVTARADATVESLIELMTQRHIGCVPIVDEHQRAMGIVTELDLIECRDGRSTAREVMMPRAMTLGPDATITQAASLMSRERFHHLLVVDASRALIGVLSTLDITHWIARQ